MARRIDAITLSAVLVISLFTGGTVAAAGVAQQAGSTAPTPISSCTTIDSPGHYVLTEDIVRPDGSDGVCIEIRASDVVLDGNGHSIDGNGSDAGVATFAATPVRNVTVRDLTVEDTERNFDFANLSDGRVRNVTSLDPGISGLSVDRSSGVTVARSTLEGGIDAALRVDESDGLTVTNNTFTADTGISARGITDSEISGNEFDGSRGGVLLHRGSRNVVSNNTLEDDPDQGIRVRGSDSVVTGNSIPGSYEGIVVSGSNHTVANNDASGISWGAVAEGVNHTIRNNTLSGGEGEGGSGGALQISGRNHTVDTNSLRGVHGVDVASATGPISIVDNRIRAWVHIEVAESKLCPDPGDVVAAHGNTFEDEYYEAYERYGVLNHDDDLVNATNNYWGAASGPSSPDGENVTDPVTGEPADGDGLPVSEGVHFDPFLSQSPANETDS